METYKVELTVTRERDDEKMAQVSIPAVPSSELVENIGGTIDPKKTAAFMVRSLRG